uniref:Uncharacterized protein n=1 Tax=Arundo donax TaxID=35708 RepID=A0A0A9HTW9_ARUDO
MFLFTSRENKNPNCCMIDWNMVSITLSEPVKLDIFTCHNMLYVLWEIIWVQYF